MHENDVKTAYVPNLVFLAIHLRGGERQSGDLPAGISTEPHEIAIAARRIVVLIRRDLRGTIVDRAPRAAGGGGIREADHAGSCTGEAGIV